MSVEYGHPQLQLDARLCSTGIFTATKNSTTEHFFTFDYGCKFNGVEILTDDNVVLGDSLRLESQYYAGPTYGWKRYKKFADGFLVKKNDRAKYVLFPTEPSSGVRISLKYTSTGTVNDVKFGVNLFVFVESESVNPSVLGEGTDW